MSQKIRVAFIGCGMMAGNHLNYFREIRDKDPEITEIVAMCDVDGERAKNLANKAGDFQSIPPTYTDLEKMLKNEDIDAVDIVTTHFNHHVSTIACLEAGIHVVVEKPFALTIKAGQMMLDAAKKSGKILASAEPARKGVGTRAMEWAMNKAHLIGDLRMFFTQRTLYTLRVVVGTPWRHQRIYGGGGWVIDGEVHYMDVLRSFFGDVERVYAETRNFEPTRYLDANNLRDPVPSDVEDTAICVLTFKNGLIGQFVWTEGAPGKGINHEIYYGSKGSIDGGGIQFKDGSALSMEELIGNFLNSLSSDDKERLFPCGITNAGTLGVYDFLDAIRSNREPEVTGWDGFVAQAICDAIYESAYCGQAVKVDDVISKKIGTYQEDINKHWGL